MAQPEPRSWTIHLAARQPGKAVLALVFILLGLFAVAALVPASVGLGTKVLLIIICAVLLVGSIAEFLFPVTYTLDADGAHARLFGSVRSLAWARVRRVYLRPDGIKLSPLALPGWIEAYRGVLLRTPERAAVLDDVRAWLQDAGATPEVIEDERC